MANRFTNYLNGTTTRHYARVVAFVVLGISVGSLITHIAYPHIQQYLASQRAEKSEVITEETSTTTPYVLSRSSPTLLRIPKINLETTFEPPLGLNSDKTIEVPDSYDKVGWYRYGPTPGEIGPAAILGHVDSYQGAAVFYHLGQLTEGDKVFITRADGTEAIFEVMYSERYSIDDFPSEKVYGETTGPELRLITCTGKYDKGEQRYSHNLVVYAKLTEATSTSETLE